MGQKLTQPDCELPKAGGREALRPCAPYWPNSFSPSDPAGSCSLSSHNQGFLPPEKPVSVLNFVFFFFLSFFYFVLRGGGGWRI